jgi:hypothetical protein
MNVGGYAAPHNSQAPLPLAALAPENMAPERIGRLCRTAETAQMGAAECTCGWATSALYKR